MREQQRYYWLPDAISLVMLLSLRLPIDPRSIRDAESPTLFIMLIAAFASLVAIARPDIRRVARWLALATGLMYLNALEAYGRDLELPPQVIYLLVQIYIPRLSLLQRPYDRVISPTTVTAISNRAVGQPARAVLSKNDQWRQSPDRPDRSVRPWKLHLPNVPLPLVTLALIALNVAVFWLVARTMPDSGSMLDFQPLRDLVPLAADRAVLDDPSQWWRLASAGAFHHSVAHLASNMLMLYWLGRFLEPLLGSIRFAIYAVAGSVFAVIMGVLALGTGDMVSGASGGVYALIGAVATVWAIHYQQFRVDGKSRRVVPVVLAYIVYSTLTAGPHSAGSQGGHLSGLLAGFFLMLIGGYFIIRLMNYRVLDLAGKSWTGLVLLLGCIVYATLTTGGYSMVSHAGHVGGILAGIVLTLIGGPYFVTAPDPDDPSNLIVYDRLSWRYLTRQRRAAQPADLIFRR